MTRKTVEIDQALFFVAIFVVLISWPAAAWLGHEWGHIQGAREAWVQCNVIQAPLTDTIFTYEAVVAEYEELVPSLTETLESCEERSITLRDALNYCRAREVIMSDPGCERLCLEIHECRECESACMKEATTNPHVEDVRHHCEEQCKSECDR